MSRSFNASVSPCFILMRFLSKHFIAYLENVPRRDGDARSEEGIGRRHCVSVSTYMYARRCWKASSGSAMQCNASRADEGVVRALQASPRTSLSCVRSPHLARRAASRGKSRQTVSAAASHLHLARIRFSAAIHFAEAPTANNAMHAEVVHRQSNVQLQVLPLAKSSIFVTAKCVPLSNQLRCRRATPSGLLRTFR